MSRFTLTATAMILALVLSACAPQEATPPATLTPFPFTTATPEIIPPTATLPQTPTSIVPTATATPEAATATPLAFVAPVERRCPHRLTGIFLRLYSSELGIQAAFGCPSSPNPDLPVAVWPVEALYQDFERGQLLRVSGYGAETLPQIIALRDNSIYTRHLPPEISLTATPPAATVTPGPLLMPSPTFIGGARPTPPVGFSDADEALRTFWLIEPGIFEQFGYATGPALNMSSEVLMLDQGDLITLPELGIVLALRRGNPGAWSVYAYPG